MFRAPGEFSIPAERSLVLRGEGLGQVAHQGGHVAAPC